MEKIKKRLRIVLHDILLYGKRRMETGHTPFAYTQRCERVAVHDALRHGPAV